MKIDPRNHSSRNIYQLMTSVVVPRPIAWVSTVDRGGNVNLAPFSYFNGITSKPPMLSISVGRRRGQRKDTANNASATGELVVNVVSSHHLAAMTKTAAEVAPNVDEFTLADVDAEPSELVKPPRVRGCRVQMECRTHQIIEVVPGIADLVIAEVLLFHLSDDLRIDEENLLVDPASLEPLARLGGSHYADLGPLRKAPRNPTK